MKEPNDMHGDEDPIGQWEVDKYVDYDIDDRLQREAEEKLRAKAMNQSALSNQQTPEGTADVSETGLALLRKPFPPHQISKLPQPTVKADIYRTLPKSSCAECGGYHPKDKTIHLSYVGHAALTDRLLDADPFWSWEPLAYDDNGLPRFDAEGGLWGKLTVCGVTRPGYGSAENKAFMAAGARTKEIIGDMLRNAAMRFGCALELWHKGVLHLEEDASDERDVEAEQLQAEADTKKSAPVVPVQLPPYPEADFTKNTPAWSARMAKGLMTAGQLIPMIETRFTLSEKQKAAIRSMEAKP